MISTLSPYRWPLEAIWEEVSPHLPAFTAEALPEIDSTNTELMRRARAGQCDPVLLVTEHQTAGRGRLGRQWLGADRGGTDGVPSLTFSVGLPLKRMDWSGLSLAVGISVAQSLKALSSVHQAPFLGLKWPNDVWWRDCKLAGILIESASVAGLEAAQGIRYAVIGVGVNLLAPVLPLDAKQPGQLAAAAPVGMSTLAPGTDAAKVLKCLVWPLISQVLMFEKQGFEPLLGSFERLDLLNEKPVVLSDGRSGIARGVDLTGALLIDIDGERLSISSGEVSVRPLHNTVPLMNGHG